MKRVHPSPAESSSSESSDCDSWAIKVFNPDGTVNEFRQANEPSLSELQAIVGGYLEAVGDDSGAHERHAIYCNEEALPRALPLNQAWEIFRNRGLSPEEPDALERRARVPALYGPVVFIRPL
jgi:hypothetical protein